MDRTIYILKNAKMQGGKSPLNSIHRDNFVITCPSGDWSSFRTLLACIAQFPELENKNKPNGFFRVVER